MGFRGQMANLPAPVKGLFDGTNNIDLSPEYTPDTRNSRFFPNYVIKRKGMTQLGGVVEASTALSGGVQFRNSAGTLVDAVTTCSSTAASRFMVLESGTWTARGGAITLSNATDARVDFCTFNDVLIGADGVNTPFKWSGTIGDDAAVLGGSPPGFIKFLAVFGNRVLGFNFQTNAGTTYKDGFCWCELSADGGEDSWGALDFLRIQQAGGTPITGVAYWSDRLLVFFENSIFEVSLSGNDLTPFNVNRLFTGHGTRAGYSIVEVDDGVYYLDSDGPYVISPADSKPRWLGRAIQETWKTIDWSKSETFSGAYDARDRIIRWGVRTTSASGSSDLILTYDQERDAWGPDSGYDLSVAWPYQNSTGTESVAGGGTARVFEFGTGNYDIDSAGTETAVSWYFWTPWLNFSEAGSGPMMRKIWFELQLHTLYVSHTLLNVGYQLALFGGTRVIAAVALASTYAVGVWDTAVWDVSFWGQGDTDQAEGRIKLEGDSTHIRLKFVENTTIQPAVEGYSFAFKVTTSL